jgi:formylmethanofuran dehydrogenase subunit E
MVRGRRNYMHGKVWIGLVHAKPISMKAKKLIEGCLGLYTNFFAMAENQNDFFEKARVFFKKEGFKVEEIEDEESFEDRIKNGVPDSQCNECAEYVKSTGKTETTDWQLYKNEE